MKRKEQLTQAMINSSFDAIFQINERGIIQMVNQVSSQSSLSALLVIRACTLFWFTSLT